MISYLGYTAKCWAVRKLTGYDLAKLNALVYRTRQLMDRRTDRSLMKADINLIRKLLKEMKCT